MLVIPSYHLSDRCCSVLTAAVGFQAQKWAGTRLSAPHGISRPGGQTSRSTPPNALTVNVADLPGDLLKPSQLAISVTAFRIIPEGTEADVEASSESLGQHNVSFLQITAPYVPVQQTPPKVLYASIDEYATSLGCRGNLTGFIPLKLQCEHVPTTAVKMTCICVAMSAAARAYKPKGRPQAC